ncbi:MAG: glycosyltransferase [Rickettsiales bacterium]|nr:glycosyltransferase [Rickettsiales bacterium]
MKIVQILTTTSGGGMEQVTIDYSRVLLSQKHEVFTITKPNSWISKNLPQGVVKCYQKHFRPWYFLDVWRLRKLLREIKPDVVIAHNRAFFIMRKVRLKDCPVILFLHNHKFKDNYNEAEAIITITNNIKTHLIKKLIPGNKVYVIQNMTTLLPSLKLERNNDKRILVIGGCGRLEPEKGFDVYIKSLKILKDKGQIFKAVLAGSGTCERKLHHLAHELGLDGTLQFLGWIGNKEDFYNSLDIFCLPSLYESFGIALLEAFVNKLPVVSTDSEGPSEIIKHNYDGILVEKNNPEALAEGIIKVLEDKELRSKLAINGYNAVKSHYSQEVVGKKISEVLSQVIKNFKESSV